MDVSFDLEAKVDKFGMDSIKVKNLRHFFLKICAQRRNLQNFCSK
jgi:hypothetical protein